MEQEATEGEESHTMSCPMSVEKSISLDPRGSGLLFFMFINKRPLNDPIRHLSVSHAQEKFLVSGCEDESERAARAA